MASYHTVRSRAHHAASKLGHIFNELQSGPYWRLIRGDKPIGWQLLAIPILWAIVLGATSVTQVIWWSCFFTFGSFVMRSAGCIINDIADRDFDDKVERTKSRPLTAGELTVRQALQALALLLTIALAMLVFLPWSAIAVAVFSLVPIAVYPLMKRFIDYPQVFLGLTFNLGIFIAWLTLQPRITYVPIFLYLCTAMWQTAYDTIYAHQDKEDDLRLGLRSMAITLGNKTKDMVWRLYIMVVMALGMMGFTYGLGILFYLGLGLGLYQLHWQVQTLDIRDGANCQKLFLSNLDFALIMLASFILGRL